MKAFNKRDWIYDLETYPNIFTCDLYHMLSGVRVLFEISDRKNQIDELYEFLIALQKTNCRMVGFNNIGFDYPILHFILVNYHNGCSLEDIYNFAQHIINTPWDDRFSNIVPDYKTIITQIDLFKIHHFDNAARSTSLKVLEFNMRMQTIEDLPYPPGTMLNDSQKNELISYNDHDVDATRDFYIETLPMIEFREELSLKYSRNFLNHNDTKIGKDYFMMKLSIPNSKNQTYRDMIALKDVIFPYIEFKNQEFDRIKKWFIAQIITKTKGVFIDLTADINGFKYVFGAGGIHGSIESCTVETDGDHVLIDWDVSSYYPNIAIVNKLYPQHLSSEFCNVYKDVFEKRKLYKKGTPENAMLKLALNGVYGDSNNKYSPFYDSQYTMAITINGQLLLCMLAEHLINIPGLLMIQINTDGLTVKCPRSQEVLMRQVCAWWEAFTCLQLEDVKYDKMYIKDVNNYIGVYTNGKVKRKGVYEYERNWSQNHSSLIIPKAAEAFLLRGEDISNFIHNHGDINDFMLRTKVSRSDQVIYNNNIELQRVTRYYVSTDGATLVKRSPPPKGYNIGQWKRKSSISDDVYLQRIDRIRQWDNLHLFELDSTGTPWDDLINTKNKSKYQNRETKYHIGYLVTHCNDIRTARFDNINYDYYIAEANKLVDPLI